jgi:predicted nucleic acid-binding protein
VELVVDANILVAGFLRAATTRELLLDERFTLWTPEYAVVETQRILLTPRIQRKFGTLSPEQTKSAFASLTINVQVLPEKTYRTYLPEAKQLALDPADAPYRALALHLHLPLWSNDAVLKEQRSVVVYTTQELLDVLHARPR